MIVISKILEPGAAGEYLAARAAGRPVTGRIGRDEHLRPVIQTA